MSPSFRAKEREQNGEIEMGELEGCLEGRTGGAGAWGEER